MLVLQARNVQDAFYHGVRMLQKIGVEEPSRAGPVLVATCPVTTVYRRPTERVLLDPGRDANPFFHHVEALWMLRGEDHAGVLNRYVVDFGSRFAEASGIMHGAYGYRWRHHFGLDQLQVIINRLRVDHATRQCVLAMWDPAQRYEDVDHGNGNVQSECVTADDLVGNWKDRPCNTHAYFRIREESAGPMLDLTVCCRSNDIVWGAYGANAVHFSVLLEYVAAMVGVDVGVMYQVSNNWHGYRSYLEGLPELSQEHVDLYARDVVASSPMVNDPGRFDEDLRLVMEAADAMWGGSISTLEANEAVHDGVTNASLKCTSWNLILAHWHWKRKRRAEALDWAGMIHASDWRMACLEWMQRRMQR